MKICFHKLFMTPHSIPQDRNGHLLRRAKSYKKNGRWWCFNSGRIGHILIRGHYRNSEAATIYLVNFKKSRRPSCKPISGCTNRIWKMNLNQVNNKVRINQSFVGGKWGFSFNDLPLVFLPSDYVIIHEYEIILVSSTYFGQSLLFLTSWRTKQPIDYSLSKPFS